LGEGVVDGGGGFARAGFVDYGFGVGMRVRGLEVETIPYKNLK
jgi:hypothetical protein